MRSPQTTRLAHMFFAVRPGFGLPETVFCRLFVPIARNRFASSSAVGLPHVQRDDRSCDGCPIGFFPPTSLDAGGIERWGLPPAFCLQPSLFGFGVTIVIGLFASTGGVDLVDPGVCLDSLFARPFLSG